MERYKPSFNYTDKIVNLIAEISSKLTGLQEIMTGEISPIQREVNRVRAIHSSLAIEGNTLSLDQVAAVINEERVFARVTSAFSPEKPSFTERPRPHRFQARFRSFSTGIRKRRCTR